MDSGRGAVQVDKRQKMSQSLSLAEWLNRWGATEGRWYIKRLSANDTLATGAHQAGPYIPKWCLFRTFPDLQKPTQRNPRIQLNLHVDSHGQSSQATAVWYNNRRFGGTRDETRITNLGGRESPLLDPNNMGALAAFVFPAGYPSPDRTVHVWIARTPDEEDQLQERFGPVDPGETVVWPTEGDGEEKSRVSGGVCHLSDERIPVEWRNEFPSGEDILRKAIELCSARPLDDVDSVLLRRRECEFQLFRSVERFHELPRIRRGFATVDDFLARAQTVLQRRKARAGRSLELHVRQILNEHGLREGVHFDHGVISDPGSRKLPDFLFPSQKAYLDLSYPAGKLRMLAVKTSCKDRWRQILNEADRIPVKHLLTLQEGVSKDQFREMKQAGVVLVVPQPLHVKFPREIRAELLTLKQFLGEVVPAGFPRQ